MLNQTCCSDLPIPQALYQPGMVLLPRWTTVCQRIHLISPHNNLQDSSQRYLIDQDPRTTHLAGNLGLKLNQVRIRRTLPNNGSEVSTMAGTLPNKGLEVSKPLRTQLGHFRIMVQKCSVDTSEVLFRGVHRTLPNLYSEVSYVAISPFNPVSCRFHWLISSFSCSQMILHIYLITVCTYFEPGRPWADIIQEIKQEIQK